MREIQIRQALREAMTEEMQQNESIYLMGEEVAEYNGAYKVTEGMLDQFGPRRVVDTPISELGFAGIGVGSAMVGLRPIVEFMTFNFALLAIDAVVNSAAKMYSMSGGQINVPIVFRGASGSAGGLAQQHSQSFENWYANVPGLYVVSPCTPRDAKGLLKSAIRNDNPVVFMESEVLYGRTGEVPDDSDFTIPLGQAEIKREGSDVTIVSFNKMVHVATEAADELAKDGIQAEVIDLRTLRPMDYDTLIASVKKTNRCVVVEESWPLASLSGEITYMIQKRAFDYLDAPVLRVTGADTPIHYAASLVDAFLPNPDKTIKAVRSVLYLD